MIADQAVARTAFSTRIQWGAIGAVVVAFGAVFSVVLTRMDAQAQSSAQATSTSTAALDASRANAARIESVDAGTRQAIENLRRDIAEERADAAKKLTDVQLTLQAVLREVKRR